MVKKVFVGLAVVALLPACNSLSEEIAPVSSDKVINHTVGEKIQLNEDYQFLEFENVDVFFDTYTFVKDGQELPGTLDRHYEGFTSQRAAFNSIDSEEEYEIILRDLYNHPYKNFLIILPDPDTDEMEAERVVSSPVLAQMINKDGMLKVGNMVQKFTYTKTLSVIDPTDGQIREMIAWDGRTTPAFGTVTEDGGDTGQSVQSRGTTTVGICSNTYPSNGRRKIVGKQQERTRTPGGTFLREWIVLVKNQRKIAGVWWANDDAALNLTFFGEYRVGTGVWQTLNVNQWTLDEEEDNRLEEVAFSCFGNNGACENDGFNFRPNAQTNHRGTINVGENDEDSAECLTTVI